MIRTHTVPCHLPKAEADTPNRESGRIYTRALVEHYRVYRQTRHWLSPFKLKQLVDFYDAQDGRKRLLHSHTTDAAQEGFPKACKTARERRKQGWDNRYPYKRKYWHIVVDDGREPLPAPGTLAAAVDLGEVHPAAVTDGDEAVVFACRALCSVKQYGHKRRAELQRLQAAKVKGSRQWKRLQRRKNRLAAQQKRRVHDIEHKVSRAVVEWAVAHQVGTLAISDVRGVGDGKRLNAVQQKVSSWGHGKLREYITYKAEVEGMSIPLVKEQHSSQTCLRCGQRHKPSGRVYRCPACGFVGHRDGQVGAVNLLSRHTQGDVGRLRPPALIKYRHPFGKHAPSLRSGQALSKVEGLAFGTGKRSRRDTAQVAWADRHGQKSQEAPALPRTRSASAGRV